ncbi:helix-turn-helix transcriptional regulator [Amphritea balenae]|uniref:DNA-binding response regulator n=1 Tax=Amphritea balenae TaxID=452629 RepID=A0A3P1SWG7_9GAMM|nr:LuxR C-terminal-related transcriptional regulator [Amphritea balenae]RRD01460.1 DNA-binding response regulator [Amphritea balenae]GGK56951.1 hypothetical protein GCM10007941_03840 [Amphritea balenae]
MENMQNQIETLIAQLYSQAKLMSPPEFQAWAMTETAELLEFDSGFWTDGIPPLNFVSLYLFNQPYEMIESYTRVLETGAQDILAAKTNENLGQAVILSEIVYPNLLDPNFKSHCLKYGILQAISLGFERPGTQLFTYITWYRNDLNRPFNHQDKLIKQMLDPHIRESYEICLLLHIQKEVGITSDTSSHAFAICNDTGNIIYCNNRFILDARLENGIINGFQVAPDTWKKLLSNEHATINIDELHLYKIDDDHYLVEIRTEQNPLAVLTEREQEIAIKLALGDSYKKIALALARSPSTIQNQATSIYKKMNISGKHELTMLLQPTTQAKELSD